MGDRSDSGVRGLEKSPTRRAPLRNADVAVRRSLALLCLCQRGGLHRNNEGPVSPDRATLEAHRTESKRLERSARDPDRREQVTFSALDDGVPTNHVATSSGERGSYRVRDDHDANRSHVAQSLCHAGGGCLSTNEAFQKPTLFCRFVGLSKRSKQLLCALGQGLRHEITIGRSKRIAFAAFPETELLNNDRRGAC